MANLNVNATVSAPENIEIKLVRADEMHIKSIFRTCFECALSLTSTLLGYVLALQNAEQIHWIFLGVSFLATIVFLFLSVRKYHDDVASA